MRPILALLLLVLSLLSLGACGPSDRQEMRARVDCEMNLRQLGVVLVTAGIQGSWPEASGEGFLLELYTTHVEVRRNPQALVCPADSSIDVDSPEWKQRLGLVRWTGTGGSRRLVWPDGLTSYAGRNVREFPLRGDRPEQEPIACDGAAFHRDGVHVLYANGRVEFLTWEDLGLSSADEFGFRYGPRLHGGPGPLAPLCR